MKLGVDGKLYFLSTGTRATWAAAGSDGVHEGAAPSNLTEISNCKDIKIPWDLNKADVTTRKNGKFKAYQATLADLEIEIEQVYVTTDTGYIALQKALLNRTTLALAMLDGDKATAAVEGLWADFSVTGFEKGEEIEGVQMCTWKVCPGFSAVAPEWIRVSAS